MSWTYDPTQLATSQLYRVRFLVGDTDTTAQLLQDAEITFAASQEMNDYGAAARCCESIANNFLRKADVRIGRGGTTLTYSTAAAQYRQMAKEFRAKAIGLNVPWTGGTSLDDKESLASDPSKVQPIFTKTLMDSPWVSQSNDTLLEDE